MRHPRDPSPNRTKWIVTLAAETAKNSTGFGRLGAPPNHKSVEAWHRCGIPELLTPVGRGRTRDSKSRTLRMKPFKGPVGPTLRCCSLATASIPLGCSGDAVLPTPTER